MNKKRKNLEENNIQNKKNQKVNEIELNESEMQMDSTENGKII